MNLTTPLKVIIVEDLALLRQRLERLLQKQPGLVVTGSCGTVDEAIALINNRKPDLLLLDIELPDGTGFDILEQISVPAKVIFLTAHNDYAKQAFRCGAIDYLLKPLNEEELGEAVQKVINAQPLLREQIDIAGNSFREKKVPENIVLRSRDFAQVVAVKEIAYLQGEYGYTTVFLHDGKKLVTTSYLKEYEELLSDETFLRPHQSYLVNKLYIDRYHKKDSIIYLKDAIQIPVSSRRKEMVDQYFKKL
ncbi:MAG: LytR/AlgR family response regulator transcription factor [Niastella sp.]|jgi:two-component system LytT family response regulator|uniref:LytR/AlgR family response regulator transcription factor n=1 Tax=Niastella sp. TaxID=1869183 RepID=UPI00389A647D